MSKKPYAHGTKVPVATSRAEIEKLLGDIGAYQFATFTDAERGMACVMFTIATEDESRRQVRLEISMKKSNAEQRRLWRVLRMKLKMKLESVRDGESTVDEEFLANVVLPNGDTILSSLKPKLDQMHVDGTIPPLLLGAGS